MYEPAPALEAPSPVAAPHRRRPPAALWVGLAALAVLGWQAWDYHTRVGDMQEQLARRLAEGDVAVREARDAAKQSANLLEALQARTASVEARLAQEQSHGAAVEQIYQELGRTRDDRVLADVEQALVLGAQQLQLASNVEAALLALSSADARLARHNAPQWSALRQAIAQDTERLKALPTADVSGMAARLDSAVGMLDKLPLAFEPAAQIKSAAPAEGGAGSDRYAQLGRELWQEFSSLLRVERLDRPAPELLSPSHALFLRENLRLRLLGARLSLLQRDARSFRGDLQHSLDWLERYFDNNARGVQALVVTIKELLATDIAVAIPNLDDSLNALRKLTAQPAADVPPLPVREAPPRKGAKAR
ncbi:MAG: uroporphyrinogen-III C-methyltransferase [Rhodocyclaceae bacterium]|nr:uroporphyrinogen-III C-methyltransferase [Rhodocyclaceae bacterium]